MLTQTLRASAAYGCSATICFGVGAAADAAIKKVQALLNKFGGSAGFKAFAADGKIGSDTVNAFNKTNAWLASKGIWAANTATKEQLAAAATGSDLAGILEDAIAKSTPAPAVVPPKPTPAPPTPGTDVMPPPSADAKPPGSPTRWPYYVAGAIGAAGVLYAAFHFSKSAGAASWGQQRMTSAAAMAGLRGMTKNDYLKWTKSVYAEANAADPYRTQEIAERVLKREVWAWDHLTTDQIRKLSSELFPLVMAARSGF